MPILTINPPPIDKKCQRCGKPISELQPFGKAGDPLVGNFEGAKLVKTFRSMNEEQDFELDKINDFLSEIRNTKGWEEAIIQSEEKFGKEKTEQAMFYEQLSNTVEASWECRDCIIT